MLSPEIIKKIKRVHIKSSKNVNTMMAGHYKSVFRGTGIEFEEVREYSPGDDVKSIDWKVSARMGRPYIKLYKEERELIIMLLIDMSASFEFGTTSSLKKETAAEIASILAFNAIKSNDKAGAILFTDRVEKYIPPQKGSLHIWRIIKEFFTFKPSYKKTDIKSAVDYLSNVLPKRTIVFLISDFLCRDYIKRLKIASNKHEIIAIAVSDPGEFTVPDFGMLSLQCLETGKENLFDGASKKAVSEFRALKKRLYSNAVNSLKTAGIDCIEIRTDELAADALIKYFKYREKRR